MEEYTLDPKVKVSDADIRELPLYNFHVVVVVEPDPETWALPDEEFESLSELLEMQCDLIAQDVIDSDELVDMALPPRAKDVEQTLMIIATEGLDVLLYFEPVDQYSQFTIKDNDFEFDKLRLLLDGIAKSRPEWNRIAIVGGVYEDEVIRAANTVQAAGFDTTIVTRYCISEKIFDNLDDILAAIDAEKLRRAKLGLNFDKDEL
jgi:hypothetical protein